MHVNKCKADQPPNTGSVFCQRKFIILPLICFSCSFLSVFLFRDKVRFMGRKQKTKHEGSTADPCFYQTVEFHEMLPGDLRFAPEIRVEVRIKCFRLKRG